MYPAFFNIKTLSGKRVQCRLYQTKRAMLSAIRKETVHGIENATLACTTWSILGQKDVSIRAFVYLCKTHLSHGIVAHELYHVAEELAARDRNTHKREENVAQVLGELVEAFHAAMPL